MTSIPQIFWAFFRVGALTLGGGLAMLGVLRHELIARRGWVSEEDFTRELAMATSLPGAMVVNFALFCGYRMRRARGAAAAFLGVVAPSFLAILAVTAWLFPHFSHPAAAAFLKGASAAVAGLLAYTAFKLCRAMVSRISHLIAALAAAGIALIPNVSPVFALALVSAAVFLGISKKKPSGGDDGADQHNGQRAAVEDTRGKGGGR